MTTPPSPPDHGGQITIGLRDLYVQLQTLNAGYASLAAKLDLALAAQTVTRESIAAQLADIRADVGDHEARLRQQESRIYVTPRSLWAGVGVLTGVFGLMFALFQVILK